MIDDHLICGKIDNGVLRFSTAHELTGIFVNDSITLDAKKMKRNDGDNQYGVVIGTSMNTNGIDHKKWRIGMAIGDNQFFYATNGQITYLFRGYGRR